MRLKGTANIAGQPNVWWRALQRDLKSLIPLSIMGQFGQPDVMQSVFARRLWHWPPVAILHHLAVELMWIKSMHRRWPSLECLRVLHKSYGLTFHGWESRDVQIQKQIVELDLWGLKGRCERSLLSGVLEQERKYFQDQLKWSVTAKPWCGSVGSAAGWNRLFV